MQAFIPGRKVTNEAFLLSHQIRSMRESIILYYKRNKCKNQQRDTENKILLHTNKTNIQKHNSCQGLKISFIIFDEHDSI